jgi:hypothetical protein
MKVKKMKISPSKPIIVFRTSFYLSYTKDNVRELEDIKGEANIRWSECENYRWLWDNAIKDSVTFIAAYNIASIEYRVVVTAKFTPEDLTYYLMRFGAA